MPIDFLIRIRLARALRGWRTRSLVAAGEKGLRVLWCNVYCSPSTHMSPVGSILGRRRRLRVPPRSLLRSILCYGCWSLDSSVLAYWGESPELPRVAISAAPTSVTTAINRIAFSHQHRCLLFPSCLCTFLIQSLNIESGIEIQ